FVKREGGEEIRPLKRKKKDAQRGHVDKAERNQGNQVEMRSIRERDRQGSCNRGHRTQLLRGNAARLWLMRARVERAQRQKLHFQCMGGGCRGQLHQSTGVTLRTNRSGQGKVTRGC